MMRRRIAAVLLVWLAACTRAEAPPSASEQAPAPASPPPSPPAASAAPAEPEPVPTPTAMPTTAPAKKPTSPPTDKTPRPKPNAPESTPPPGGGATVAVHANNRFACTGGEKREDVFAAPEPHGARITITGQGPCPGEVRDWKAELRASRIEVNATHGTPSKCRCTGAGDLVLRGVPPGAYEVQVNGGFDRPIAARVVVPQ